MNDFLDSIILPSPTTNPKSINGHLTVVEKEISRVETQIQSTIKSNWPDFQQQSLTSSSLYHRSLNIESQLNQIEQKLADPQKGLIPLLLHAIQDHQEITVQHSESTQNLRAIQSLSTAYHELSKLSQLINADDLVTAASQLPATKSAVQPLYQYASASSLAKRAVQRIQELEEDLKQRLIDIVRACFTFATSNNNEVEDSVFEFNSSVIARTRPQNPLLITWNSAVDGLQSLAGEECVTGQLKRTATLLIEKIVTPLIESFSSESTHLVLHPKATSNEFTCVMTFKSKTQIQVIDLYDSLRSLLCCLQPILSRTQAFKEKFSQHLIPPLEAKLLNEALDSSVPCSSRDKPRLNQLSEVLSQTRLLGVWLQDQGWLSHRETQRSTLVDWCDRIQDRFLHKVATRVFELARNEMITTQWENLTVPWEIILKDEPMHTVQQKSFDKADPKSLPAVPNRSSGASHSTTDQQYAESLNVSSPKQATGLQSLFSFVGSASHRSHTPDTTSSQQATQGPKSPSSPPSKTFRSLFNFSAERSAISHSETSQQPSSSSTEKTSSPEIIDHLSDISPPQSIANKPSSPQTCPPLPMVSQPDNQPEEDVDWDMGGEPTVDSGPSHNSASSNPNLVEIKGLAEEEIEEDAWGFDGSNEAPTVDTQLLNESTSGHDQTSLPNIASLAVNPQETKVGEDDEELDPDAWGFEQEEVSLSDDNQVMRLRGGVSSPASDKIDDDGWDWNEDVSPEDSNHQDASNGKRPANKGKDRLVLANDLVNSAMRTEQLIISKLAQRILEIVQELVDDAAETRQPDFASPSLSQSSPGLINLAFDVLDLFRIVMVVHHAKLLDSVPSLSVQFSNDCDWLAKQIQLIPLLSEKEVITQASNQLKELGCAIREKQLSNQKAALMECLDEAEGFVETSRDDRFLACQRACKQVDHTLERLAQVWKPVMLKEEYLSSMGRLVQEVLTRILSEIEEQVDIEESDSKQLNLVCKSLHSLIRLFELQPDFNSADIYRYVPSWFKFCFLSELLEASMADIMWMYQEGHLSEFSKGEIVGLIKALFADSELRATNIDLILQ